jgi:hypothetical protein
VEADKRESFEALIIISQFDHLRNRSQVENKEEERERERERNEKRKSK